MSRLNEHFAVLYRPAAKLSFRLHVAHAEGFDLRSAQVQCRLPSVSRTKYSCRARRFCTITFTPFCGNAIPSPSRFFQYYIARFRSLVNARAGIFETAGGRCPQTVAAALGGRCPQTVAAALGRDDFESGSDSKSGLVRGGWIVPNLTQIESDSDSICFVWWFEILFCAAIAEACAL